MVAPVDGFRGSRSHVAMICRNPLADLVGCGHYFIPIGQIPAIRLPAVIDVKPGSSFTFPQL
jgi:hypothetical protein